MASRIPWLACALALGACSHDFQLVDPQGGDDAAVSDAPTHADASHHLDAGTDGSTPADAAPSGPLVLVTSGFSTESAQSGSNNFQVIGGFASSPSSCGGAFCVQGGIHP